jgi:hypothetical protein
MEARRGLFRSDAQAFAAYALGFLPIPVPYRRLKLIEGLTTMASLMP